MHKFAGAGTCVLICGALLAGGPAVAGAAGTFITLSSTTYDSGGTSAQTFAAAIDSDTVIVTGYISQGGGRDVLTVRYNADLTRVLSQATFDQGGTAQGNAITTDSAGNVIIVGQCQGSGTDILVVKYSPDLSQVLGSIVFNSGSSNNAAAYGVSVDAEDNIVIAGSLTSGSRTDWLTMIYDSDLTELISSVTIRSNGNGVSTARAAAVDVSSNIFVTGQYFNGTNTDYLTVKYDPSLKFISSTTYNGSSNGNDGAYGMLLDEEGNLWVTGSSSEGGERCRTLKYGPNLALLASFASPDPASGRSVDLEPYGTVVVAGRTPDGAGSGGYVVRFSSDLARVVSSAVFQGMPGGRSEASAVVVDSSGCVIAAGYKERSANIYEAVAYRYYPMPVVSYVSPETVDQGDVTDLEIEGENFHLGATVSISGGGITISSYSVVSSTMVVAWITVDWQASLGPRNVTITNTDGGSDVLVGAFTVNNGLPAIAYVGPETVERGERVDLEIEGDNFDPGATLQLSGTGITVSSYSVVSSTVITAFIVVAVNAPPGFRDVTVTNLDGGAGTMTQAFAVQGELTVDMDLNVTVFYYIGGREIKMEIPAESFDDTVSLLITTAAFAGNCGLLKSLPFCVEITNDLNLPPVQPLILTITYRDADVAGFDEKRLTVGWFDDSRQEWVALPSTVYPGQNRITVRINHLSRFALFELAPAAALNDVIAFPNPFDPARQTLVLDNLTPEAGIRIFTVTGELVRNVEYANGSGRALWDGRNDGGRIVASGVYIVLIKGPAGTRKLKVAVEK